MLSEIRHLARVARELWRARTATAVTIIAGDDNLTDLLVFGMGDMANTELVLFTALRQLPRPNTDRINHAGLRPFSDAAQHLAIGMAELWPRFPALTLHGQIGPPAARVTIALQLDGEEVARATIAERPRLNPEELARRALQ